MTIKPLSDRVLIEPAKAEEVTAGGIIMASMPVPRLKWMAQNC